jgi:hypothetical protein
MHYEVTGVDVYGKRFKGIYTRYALLRHIHIHNGTFWQRNDDGSRTLLWRVRN